MYKSSEKYDPNNYRVYTLLYFIQIELFGEVFNTVLYKRLESDIENQKILSQAQCGFRKNLRPYFRSI